MAGQPERIGIEAALETAEFNAKVSAYIESVNNMTGKNQAAAKAMNQVGSASSVAARAMSGITSAIGAMRGALDAIVRNLPLLLDIFGRLGPVLPAGPMQRFSQAAAIASGAIKDQEKAARQHELALAKIRSKAREASSGIQDFGSRMTLAVVAGNLLVAGLNAVTSALSALGQRAFEATAFQERLGLSLESLVARELKQAGAVASVTEGLTRAAPAAEALQRWIQQLAILSPFSQQDVAAAFQLQLSYGFASDEAKRLTTVLLDLASVSPIGAQAIDRVSLALGQMRARGQVTGGELRQLSEAGVPVNDILQRLGFTLDDVSKGLVGSNLFIEEFARSVEEDLGGAALRQAGTIQGLANSIKDIIDIGLADFFREAFVPIQPHVTAFVEKLTNLLPLASELGAMFGGFLSTLIENKDVIIETIAVLGAFAAGWLLVTNAAAIFGTVTAIITAVGTGLAGLLAPIALIGIAVGGLAALFVFSFSDIQSKTGDFFNNMSGDLFQWGHDIIISLANGMAAAASAVIDVLIQLGQLITGWLAPGSPPKLLPDIDKWGQGAVAEYLKGWTKGDFDLLKGIAGPIEQLLRSLPEDVMAQQDIIPAIFGTRSAISNAISQFKDAGQVSEEALQGVFKQLRVADPAVQGYVRSMFQLEVANARVEKAQAKLNAVQEKYRKLLEPIDKELSDIEAEREKFVESQRKEELQAVLRDPSAPAEAKRFAMLELREMQLKANRKQLLQNQSVEEAAAQAELDKEKAAQEAAKAQVENNKAALELQAEQNNLLKEQLKLLDRLADKGAEPRGRGGALGEVKPPDLSKITGAFSGIAKAIPDMLGGLKDKLATFWAEITAPFAPVLAKLDELRSTWGTAWALIIAKAGEVWAVLEPVFQGIWDWLSARLGEAAGTFNQVWTEHVVPAWEGAVDYATKTLFPKLGELGTWLITTLPENISTMATEFGNKQRDMQTGWNDFWTKLQVIGNTLMTTIQTTILNLLRGLFRSMGLDLDVMSARWGRIWADVELIASTIWTRIVNWVTTQVKNIQTQVTATIGELQEWWGETWDAISTKVGEIWDAIGDAVTEKVTWLTGPEGPVQTALAGLKKWFDDQIAPWFNIGAALFQGLINGLLSKVASFVQAVTTAVELAMKLIKEALGIQSPSKVTMGIGEQLMRGLALGIQRGTGQVIDSMSAVGSALLASANFGALPAPAFAGATSPALTRTRAAPGPLRTAGGLGGSTTTVNNNFGGVSISNGMDETMFQLMVERAVARALE